MPSLHLIPPIVWPGKGKCSVWTDLSLRTSSVFISGIWGRAPTNCIIG